MGLDNLAASEMPLGPGADMQSGKLDTGVSPPSSTIVHRRPDGPNDRRTSLKVGDALCLSGGAYRAMLFHLGTLWRLNDAGRLTTLKMISSVSGGSITAGVLALAFPDLDVDADGVARNFRSLVAEPIMAMARRTIDWQAGTGRHAGDGA